MQATYNCGGGMQGSNGHRVFGMRDECVCVGHGGCIHCRCVCTGCPVTPWWGDNALGHRINGLQGWDAVAKQAECRFGAHQG